MINPFFKNDGPFSISDILKLINLNNLKIADDQKIADIKDLFTSKKNEITIHKTRLQRTFCVEGRDTGL